MLTSFITNLARLLEIEAVSFVSSYVTYFVTYPFQNIILLPNYFYFKFMKQKCYFYSILTA